MVDNYVDKCVDKYVDNAKIGPERVLQAYLVCI